MTTDGRVKQKMSTSAKGTVFMLISALCYGVSPALVKIQFDFGLNSSSVLMYRSGFAVLIIFGIMLFQKKPVTVSRFDRKRLFIVGFFCALSLTVLVESYAFIDVGLASALHYTFPMFVNVLSALVFRQILTGSRLLSLLLGLSGVFVLAFNTSQKGAAFGIFLAVLSGFLFAVYMLVLERLPFENRNALLVTMYLNLAIALYTLLYNIAFARLRPISSLPSGLHLILLAVINGVLALLFFRSGVLLLGASRASIVATIEPLFSVMFGVLIVGEPLTTMLLIGLVLILVGLLIGNLSKQKGEAA